MPTSLDEGPTCDIRWPVHACARLGQSFTGRTVPRHLYPLSVKLAYSVANLGLSRKEILEAASTLCRYRWRTLCMLRSAHRSVVPYPHIQVNTPLCREYSALLGEPYVSQAKVAAFGLICLDRAAVHAFRGNVARAGSYTNNATTVVDIFGKPNPRIVEMGKAFAHPRKRGSFDVLGKILEEMVTLDRDISDAAAWEELRAMAGSDHPVLQEVNDEEISYRSRGKDRKPLSRKGFESRMTRVRKKVKEIYT